MKAVVFGANGQLGRALLAAAGAHEVRGFSAAEIDIGASGAAAEAIATERPDWVVNAAALTAVDALEEAEEEAMRINAAAAGGIAKACAEHGARMAQVSTDYVFGGGGDRPWRPDDTPSPLGAYGRSKLAGEEAVRAALSGALILRSAWIYSAGPGNFAATMLRLMAGGGPVRVVADQIGTPTHAASLARAIWALADAKVEGIHHFTDAGAASWYDFAVAIEEEARTMGMIEGAEVVPITTDDYPSPAKRPSYSLLDCRETWQVTGVPNHWRTELRAMLAARAAHA